SLPRASRSTSRGSRRSPKESEGSRGVHGRGLPRQPRAGRVGRRAASSRARQGALRRRAADDEQSDGADRGDPRARGAEGAVPRAALYRFDVREEGRDRMVAAVGQARLAHRGQEVEEESGPLDGARCADEAPLRELALGAWQRRPRRERTRGSARESRARGGAPALSVSDTIFVSKNGG